MDKTLTILFFLFSFNSLVSQVVSGNKIIMTGDTEEDRQVKNIATPVQLDQAVNVHVIQTNYLKFGNATGDGNNISVELPIAPPYYQEGMSVYFLANNLNTDTVTLNINSLGAIPVYKNVDEHLDSAEILNGQMVQVIFDGQNFQVLSDLNIPCPNGFIEVTKDYCIEINERDTATLYEAMNICGDLGGKLCNWDNWYYACQHDSIGVQVQDMVGNWEWIDEGGNNLSSANYSTNTVYIVGATNCSDRTSSPVVDNTTVFVYRNYRCCYHKRP